ncbi:unnamed protein product [Lepeophtheirus salmonis]|uniref:(salmon louse) hypothetical protein n=1 Tax=Lepeophtheirus salmonis TaxID=72036 RepID=A0A817FFH3_LEPSM|nr:unnamed protein product [Lepeophtheirus salmonis]
MPGTVWLLEEIPDLNDYQKLSQCSFQESEVSKKQVSDGREILFNINWAQITKSKSAHDMIRAAMDHIESQTCVRFVKTDENSKKQTLLINGESQCSSTIGYAGLQEDNWDGILSLNVTICLIKVGTIFPDYHEARTQYLFLTNITIHPQYNSSTLMNDIAVVKTSFEPVLSDGVVPICLPTNSSHYYEGRAATYTYVNNKTETERTMQVQKFGILKVVSNDGFGLKKENTKIVAKRGFQFDANQIVSGPLVMKENGNCTVIGISSKLNVSETNSNISDEIGFTRVDQYLDWIEGINY